MKEEWLMPGAIVPVNPDTTKALVDEIKRLIGVVGGMALQQAEKQEPVAWNSGVPPLYPEIKDGETISVEYLETTPQPQREWVGLTDEEIYDSYNEPRSDSEMVAFARAIEAKLKEKNT